MKCRALSDEEAEALLAAVDGPQAQRDRAWICVGLYLGFRVHEIMSLRLTDVLDSQGNLRDTVTVGGTRMKNKHSRTVDFRHPTPRAALSAWIDELMTRGWRHPSAYLFQSRRTDGQSEGRAITTRQAYRIIRGLAEGISMRPRVGTHSLRHTAARWYLRYIGDHPEERVRKRSIRYLQEFLGHVSLGSTQAYVDTEADVHRAVLDAFPVLRGPFSS